MNIAIIKYNAGNIYSVVNAIKRLGIEPLLTDHPEESIKADRVLLPGQGQAKTAMACLREKGLDKVITQLRQPVLGICIGQQLLCRHSEEGDTDCLGIFDAEVKRFLPTDKCDKVPAMGWNNITELSSPLFAGMEKEDSNYVYFVHSYYVPLSDYTIAKADYITSYSAALHKDNFYATQFHPEKSGKVGELILKNFLTL